MEEGWDAGCSGAAGIGSVDTGVFSLSLFILGILAHSRRMQWGYVVIRRLYKGKQGVYFFVRVINVPREFPEDACAACFFGAGDFADREED